MIFSESKNVHIYIYIYIYIYIKCPQYQLFNSEYFETYQILSCPVGWSCRMCWLHLCKGVRHLPKCPGYDTKQSDGEVPVMLELWGMRSTPSLPLLPGPLWPWVVTPDRVLSIGQIELNCVLVLNWIAWNKIVSLC